MWPAGTFWTAYSGNRDEAIEGVIDADPVAAAVRALMTTSTEWTGIASEAARRKDTRARNGRKTTAFTLEKVSEILVTLAGELIELQSSFQAATDNYHHKGCFLVCVR